MRISKSSVRAILDMLRYSTGLGYPEIMLVVENTAITMHGTDGRVLVRRKLISSTFDHDAKYYICNSHIDSLYSEYKKMKSSDILDVSAFLSADGQMPNLKAHLDVLAIKPETYDFGVDIKLLYRIMKATGSTEAKIKLGADRHSPLYIDMGEEQALCMPRRIM